MRSLNREKRTRELLRVAAENQDIVGRITRKRAQYDRQVWEKDWERNLNYMESITLYPNDWWKDKRVNKIELIY
jgi:spore maturation protein CgeB